MTSPAAEQPTQPAPEYVISALTEELRRLNDNRWYLLSLLAQKDAEIALKSAQVSQLASELETRNATSN